MYEVLAMVKPDALFTPDDMESMLRKICTASGRELMRSGPAFTIRAEDAELRIFCRSGPDVVEESNDMAEYFGIPCEDCAARYEISGDDFNMVLLNGYILINEWLQETKRFVLFDSQQGKLLFDD